MNTHCALALVATPATYMPSFQLEGTAGSVMVRSLGLLFLMWNVPYAVAVWHPLRHRLSLMEAIAMQTIGLAGEVAMLSALPEAGHVALRATGQRFVRYDAIGLLLLLLALGCVATISRRVMNVGA